MCVERTEKRVAEDGRGPVWISSSARRVDGIVIRSAGGGSTSIVNGDLMVDVVVLSWL